MKNLSNKRQSQMNTNAITSIILILVCVVFVEQSAAIPAFARKYDMTCGTCHAPVPHLKPYGEEFMANGYQIPDKEPPRFFRETGDDHLLLMRELPLALRINGYARWQPQTEGKMDFQAPFLIKILSGGQIARDVSYFFYFLFDEKGEIAGVEDAFLMFNNVFGSELDINVGQYQVSDPLFKRELRLTLEDYVIYGVRPGNSHLDLIYDRGLMLSYGFPTKTDVVFQVLNGSGIGPANGASFDNDPYKNFMLRVSQDAGEHFRIGAFGYVGKEKDGSGVVNSSWLVGPDLTLTLDKLQLNAQYIERQDDNPFFTVNGTKAKTRGAFAELIYSPKGDESTWYGVALYNWAESKVGEYKYHSLTGHGSYMLARNLRLIGEYTYDFQAKANKFSVGFVSAF